MSNAIKAKQDASAEFENVLKEAGWEDAWGLTDDEIKGSVSPLFYRSATPKVAGDSKVVEDGVGRNLYAIYKVMDVKTNYSENAPHHFDVTIVLTIYSDDAYTFSQNSPFSKYLEKIYQKLTEKSWAVECADEQSTKMASDRAPYSYCEILYATNIYN